MTSSSVFSTPLMSSRYRMCIILPSFPSSVKLRFIELDIFIIISARWITWQTSLTETRSDISRMLRFAEFSFRRTLCFSRIWRVELMFRIISSLDLR